MKKPKYTPIERFINIWCTYLIYLICDLIILPILFLKATSPAECILYGLLFISTIIISPFYLKFLKNRYK